MTWWQWTLLGVVGYTVVGYLLSCLAVRIEWWIENAKGNDFSEKERRSTNIFIRTMWPITVFAFALFMAEEYEKLDRPGVRLPITDWLSTPTAVRKARRSK